MQSLNLERVQTNFVDLKPGDWFFPMVLKGVDQHDLIPEAIALGVEGFVFEEGRFVPSTAVPHFGVRDLRDYLFSQAEARRSSLGARCAVITGSSGKTSVKEIVAAIFRSWNSAQVHASPENQNTKIALATQILRMPSTCNLAVFEMGARRVGDFKIPLGYLQPSVVALLNIGTAHVGEFGSIENLISEKLSALTAPTAHALVVPVHDPRILEEALRTEKPVFTFGHGDLRPRGSAFHIGILEDTRESLLLSIDGKQEEFRCPYLAPARAVNIAAAVAISLALDVPLDSIRAGLNSFSGVARRFEQLEWSGTPVIDDAFNASPESMEAGLVRLRELFGHQRILLTLGSMLELGDATAVEHARVGRRVFELFGNLARDRRASLAVIGIEARSIAEEAIRQGFPPEQVHAFGTAKAAQAPIRDLKRSFDLLYFKGSKSVGLREIFGVS